MDQLHAPHQSARGRRLPMRDMDSLEVSSEHLRVLEEIALDVFTTMSNAGYSFSETLAAVYFSGIQHALSHKKD